MVSIMKNCVRCQQLASQKCSLCQELFCSSACFDATGHVLICPKRRTDLDEDILAKRIRELAVEEIAGIRFEQPDVRYLLQGLDQLSEDAYQALRVMVTVGLKYDINIVLQFASLSKIAYQICNETVYHVQTVLVYPSNNPYVFEYRLEGLTELVSYIKAVRYYRNQHTEAFSTWNLAQCLIIVGAYDMADALIEHFGPQVEFTPKTRVEAIWLNGTMSAYNRYEGKRAYESCIRLGLMEKSDIIGISVLGNSAELLQQNPINIEYQDFNLITWWEGYVKDMLKYNRDNYRVLSTVIEISMKKINTEGSETVSKNRKIGTWAYNLAASWTEPKLINYELNKIFTFRPKVIDPVPIPSPRQWPPGNLNLVKVNSKINV
jgi:hypothetical protein